MNRDEIAAEVARLGPWFHNMDIGGVRTAPDHFLGDYPAAKFRRFRDAVPADLHGATVLDIGCNAGFYAMEMKRRGADRVVGIDTDERYLAQARLAARVNGLDLVLRRMDVYEVAALGERFDFVLFMGVFYHLRHPLLALDLVRAHVVGHRMLFQSMVRGATDVESFDDDYPFDDRDVFDRPGWPKMHFVENRYARDETNWWIPNRACVEAMLRSAGFRVAARPEEEVWLCEVAP